MTYYHFWSKDRHKKKEGRMIEDDFLSLLGVRAEIEPEDFLKLVNAFIGFRGIKKKVLALRCGVSRPHFSQIIQGEKEMSEKIRDRLAAELGIGFTLEKLRKAVGKD